jgi:hypothetical protein
MGLAFTLGGNVNGSASNSLGEAGKFDKFEVLDAWDALAQR